ncbi:cartilage matrix protein-like, partial [Mizuhopecten yessoensis]|uniref:cartilage matrix protein-like n=1 Tax=Mizuhopecten yessoensis TaxID=6573 RepID=UPI000B45F769
VHDAFIFWLQVDEDKFNTTTNCAHYTIREECSIILSEFQIDWSSVQWTDLLKPLYSGLAASLYLKLQGADPAPGDLAGQASLWKSYFQPTQNLTTYTTKIQQKESTADDSCDYKPIDIVFIIDESGSVGSSNFAKILTFLTEVVDDLNIGSTAVQVGLVKFHTRATLEFYLGTHSTKTSLKSAILNTRYRSGGTSIGAGIQHADKYVFPILYGGRKDATKIAILVTDGVSSSATFTKQAADDAKANHIRIFAVGIGNINIAELNSAASDPDCTHVSVLTNFKQIDDIIYEIKKSACRGRYFISTF